MSRYRGIQSKSPRKSNTGAIAGLIGLGFLWVAFVFAAVIAIGAWLMPYTIETWSQWFGHPISVQWWEGLLVAFALALLTRAGVAYIAIVCGLITAGFQFFGFTGF